MPRTLAQWLTYQERVNVRSIELGLDRVRAVWLRLGAPTPATRVITVAGTNGKGSTVAMLEAMLRGAGKNVGSFTSPHLLAYNERVRLHGMDVDDARLIDAFERIEVARTAGTAIALTYFEFGTLAALLIFADAGLDVAVLEVGLGGRLDAVNIIDANVAVITTVDLDHMEWLGSDRHSIGREKAGVARAGQPAIVGQCDPPQGLLDALKTIGARIEQAGEDFETQRRPIGWRWHHRSGVELVLPLPALGAPVQLANAAAAIAALHALDWTLLGNDPQTTIAQALAQLHLDGRLQCLGGDPVLYVDVGHNPQAAQALAQWLDQQDFGTVHAVFGALADKDIGGVVAALGQRITHWHLADLREVSPRGLSTAALAQQLAQTPGEVAVDDHASVADALAGARRAAVPGDCILAFGSFFVAAAALRAA